MATLRQPDSYTDPMGNVVGGFDFKDNPPAPTTGPSTFSKILSAGFQPSTPPVATLPTLLDTGGMQRAEQARQKAAQANIDSLRQQAVAPTVQTAPAPTYGDSTRPYALGSLGDTLYQTKNLAASNTAAPGQGLTIMDDTAQRRADAERFAANAQMDQALRQGSWSPRKGFQGNEPAIQAAATRQQAGQRLQELSLKHASDNTLGLLRDATERRGQDIQATTAAGAQDVTLRGQEMTAATARANARLDQMNKDRQFGLDTQKFANEQEEQDYKSRQEANKTMHDRILTLLPPGADGKPDTAMAAQHMQALNAHVAERQALLQAQIARGGPNAAAAKAELAEINKRGVGAMDDTSVRNFITGQQATALANSTATGKLNPFGTKNVGGTAPITSLRYSPGLIGGDYISNRGDEIPGRYIDGGLFGMPNRDLQRLIVK